RKAKEKPIILLTPARRLCVRVRVCVFRSVIQKGKARKITYPSRRRVEPAIAAASDSATIPLGRNGSGIE
ncbi:AGAP011957-PA, partial [Anopheles gambiae str. PEST]